MRLVLRHEGKRYWRVPFSNIAYAPGWRAWWNCTWAGIKVYGKTYWTRLLRFLGFGVRGVAPRHVMDSCDSPEAPLE